MKTKSLTNWEYVLEEDRHLPREEQTVHLFRPLTFDEDTVFQQLIENDRGATAAALLLQATYVGHRNMLDAEGQVVEERLQSRSPLGTKVRTLSDSTLDLLTSKQRNELIRAVVAASEITEEDAKN